MRVFPGVRAARGVMLGLLLGDAVGAGRGQLPPSGPIKAGSGGQLACWTLEGLIRAHVRGMHKGMTTPSGVSWYAYRRWAAVRGEVPSGRDDRWWRDSGWLVHVPVLGERRGTAPATVAAVKNDKPGTVEAPVGTSLGAHAVTRSLPVGLCEWYGSTAGVAADIAALTHAGEAITTAALGAAVINHLCKGETLHDAVTAAAASVTSLDLPASTLDLTQALQLAQTAPHDAGTLRGLAPNGTAMSALLGGAYVAAGVRNAAEVRAALLFAGTAGDGGHVATVAGAMLGAVHGPACLPEDWLSRLELVWVGDTLARDYVQQLEEGPSGSEYSPGPDPTWLNRYPGG